MKKMLFSLLSILVLSVLLTSCRPPELEGAFVEYKQGRIDNALKLAKEATEKYPNNSEAWFLYGEIQGQKENYKEMVDAFDKSLAIDKTFETKIKQAKDYYFQSEFNKGVNNYNAYIKQEDRNSDKAKELLKKSLKNFQNANAIEEDYKATSLIGFGHILLDEKEEALKYYKRCTELKPDTSDGWIALGNFYMVEQKYAEAIPPLEKALELDPNNTEAVSLLSQAYDLNGDQEKAVKLYEKAMALNPDEKAFPFNLGLIYYKSTAKDSLDETTKNSYLQKSRDYFAKVIELDPDVKEAYKIKSSAEIQLGDFESAKETLLQASEKFPDDGEVWYFLGVAYGRLGDAAKAKESFAKAEELGYKL